MSGSFGPAASRVFVFILLSWVSFQYSQSKPGFKSKLKKGLLAVTIGLKGDSLVVMVAWRESLELSGSSRREKMPESQDDCGPGSARVFATTHWSVVMAASQDDPVRAGRALEALCRGYWYPIYVYVRRKGYGAEEAEDLTQEFFAQLIGKDHLRRADPNKGKFRTFLLSTLGFFLAREWKRSHRKKRGGEFSFVSLDQQSPEDRYRLEPADKDTPEKKFLREWAITTLNQAMVELEKECSATDKGALFREAQGLISGDRDSGIYSGIAERLAMTEGAARVAVHRLRQRYGELLKREVAQTVGNPEEVEEELRSLLQALSS
jgi:RNA polymerase sigma-70 factor (ECF subfamily)